MCTTVSQWLCSFKRKMFYLCIYHCLLPVSLSLCPCYEAIDHEILDSEEIILYIEGQRCHLEEKAQSNHLPVFAFNKGQCYFYPSIEAEGGGQEPAEEFPRTAVIYRLGGHPQGELRNYTEVTQMARLERGFMRSTQ